MPATYQKHGLQFLYPDNWELKEDEELTPSENSPVHQITLETPTGGQWILHVFPPGGDTETLLDDSIAELKRQYEDIEFSIVAPRFGDFETRGIEANFFCLDFVVSAQIVVISTVDSDFLVWYQAENRDFDQQLEVYDAVTMSLLQSVSVLP